jgi:HEXXH motif-containing protein
MAEQGTAVMSTSSFALTLPNDDARSTRTVRQRFLKKLARDTLTLPVDLFGADLAATARQVMAVVRRFGKADPAPLYGVLRRPHVHVHLCCAQQAIALGDRAQAVSRSRAFLFQFLFELALEGHLDRGIDWPTSPPLNPLCSPSRRCHFHLPQDIQALHFHSDLIRLDGAHGDIQPSEHVGQSDRFWQVDVGIVMALEDQNPISDFEAHPDKEGNRLELGEASTSTWVAALSEGMAMVARVLPELHQEMPLILQQLIPVGTHDETHLSASYREAIGTSYLTLHPRLMSMVEALIHEYQHSKINMLFHVDEVMRNAYHPLYCSPVRPDPRPLHGVLLAAHAFVPVAELYKRLRETQDPLSQKGGFNDRFRQIIANNEEALGVIREYADPTPLGDQLISDLDRTHRTHLAVNP